MKLGSHVKKDDTDVNMRDWLVSTRSQRVTFSIYKYGNEIGTKAQLTEFTAMFIAPITRDRSGAPTESVVQEYIAKLHSKWDGIWEGDGPIWRLWATHVVKPPMLAWETRVQQQPPPHILARLRHSTTAQDQRFERLLQNTRTSMEIVDGALLELEQLVSIVNAVNQRLEIFQRVLVSKREILIGKERDLAPISASELPIPTLDASANLSDQDHDFSLEDSVDECLDVVSNFES
ncbi:hypothetical protein LEN26_015313 [Aphanomyces euteiches]|nr:hypothetical protein LEN26_015313 [Aphanomyces euteiches]KAH9121678.1 hypothetical protein AeMF1_006712 [Aphanomyces euteiches]KAH9183776.1 hypothetical protein AeNC1_014249 [Aphanomyces euteiches]